METIIHTWDQAVRYVLLTKILYLHQSCSIQLAEGSKCICISTPYKSIKLTPDDAVTYLNEHFEF